MKWIFWRTRSVFTYSAILGLLIFSVNTCQRFDPGGFLHISTDTITYLNYGNYLMTGAVVEIAEEGISQHGFCWSESSLPTIKDPSSQIGTLGEKGSFRDTVSGLSPSSTYYIRAYAVSSEGTSYGDEVTMTTGQEVTDFNGNTYRTIEIGDQIWMGENLKASHYSDGTPISIVEDETSWEALTPSDRAYSWYDNTEGNANLYGALYTWPAASKNISSAVSTDRIQGVCPSGWHLPNDDEWKVLELFLGMSREDADGTGWRGDNEGGKLKEEGYDHWDQPNTGATNSSMFTALPGGYRSSDGLFENEGYGAAYWLASQEDDSGAWIRYLDAAKASSQRIVKEKGSGFSVRCVKGDTSLSGGPTVETSVISGETETTANGGGEVISDGGSGVTARGLCWGSSALPTILDDTTLNGSGTGSFTSTITGLTASSTYYVRAYAINSIDTAYGAALQFTTLTPSGNTVTDFDGNEYQIVEIGEQIWMAENLKTTHYADGSAISLVEGSTEWATLKSSDKAYSWYDNSFTNRDVYGGLYNWAAAMNGASSSGDQPSGIQGVCPAGWHLPSDGEWKALEMFLGMSQADADGLIWRGTDEGGKLKEEGSIHWDNPNTGATNSSGFTALPAGYREPTGAFDNEGYSTGYWTTTEKDEPSSWIRYLNAANAGSQRDFNETGFGFSVRCVKGEAIAVKPTVISSAISGETETTAIGGGDVSADGGAEVTARGLCWSSSSSPTILDDTTLVGSGTGAFVSTLTGLAPSSTYYVRAYAINSVEIAYGSEIEFTTLSPSANTVTDIDGNVYQTVDIGDQRWMAENLKTTRYAGGSVIPLVEGSSQWDALTYSDKAYSWYDNSSVNGDSYGGLYTWSAAMNGMASSSANPSGVQGVCPDGWHLPSDEEWKELEMSLGMSRTEADILFDYRGSDEGGKMKESGTSHWASPNSGATNASDFTALSAGYRDHEGLFAHKSTHAYFWNSTEAGGTYGPYRQLHNTSAKVGRYETLKVEGLSIRCLED